MSDARGDRELGTDDVAAEDRRPGAPTARGGAVSRSTYEILSTGPYNSDERRRLREEGFVWRRCDWCRLMAYTKVGLCRPCRKELR